METILNLLDAVTKNYGVRMRRYGDDFLDLETYDDGLRSRLFPGYRAKHLSESLAAIVPGAVYITKDVYTCHYCFFRIPTTGDRSAYCVIGPWLEDKPDDARIDAILKEQHIPYYFRSDLAHYFDWVTQITSSRSWKGTLFAFAAALYDTSVPMRMSYTEIDINEPVGEYSPEPEAVLSMQKVEERYQAENAMSDAISQGEANIAFQFLPRYRGYLKDQGTGNELRDYKDYTIVLNTLSRKAAERSYVHPLHIDAISMEFIRRIEAASGTAELDRLIDTILHRYSMLVREFSLKGYSPAVRNVINFVDFNLQEPLSLNLLATRFNVNPSYLSALFKKEKGTTLTGYINAKRMQHAASLLRGSGLYIQDVAEQCGFLDFNYFTRLFKRHYGQSPREFRAQFNMG